MPGEDMKTTHRAVQFADADLESNLGDDCLLDAEDREFGNLLDDLETLQDFRGMDLDYSVSLLTRPSLGRPRRQLCIRLPCAATAVPAPQCSSFWPTPPRY